MEPKLSQPMNNSNLELYFEVRQRFGRDRSGFVPGSKQSSVSSEKVKEDLALLASYTAE